MKMAVVDVQRAVMQSEDGMRAQATLKKVFDSRQQELNKRQTDLQKQKEEIDKQKTVLSQAALQKKVDDWQKEMVELQQTFVEYNKELEKKQKELTDPIFERVLGAIKRIAGTDGYDLIVDRATVAFARGDLDLTDRGIRISNGSTASAHAGVARRSLPGPGAPPGARPAQRPNRDLGRSRPARSAVRSRSSRHDTEAAFSGTRPTLRADRPDRRGKGRETSRLFSHARFVKAAAEAARRGATLLVDASLEGAVDAVIGQPRAATAGLWVHDHAAWAWPTCSTEASFSTLRPWWARDARSHRAPSSGLASFSARAWRSARAPSSGSPASAGRSGAGGPCGRCRSSEAS